MKKAKFAIAINIYFVCVCAKRFVQFSQDYHTVVDIAERHINCVQIWQRLIFLLSGPSKNLSAIQKHQIEILSFIF